MLSIAIFHIMCINSPTSFLGMSSFRSSTAGSQWTEIVPYARHSVPPEKARKEANIYKPFLCGKHYSGKKIKDPLGKARVPRMASFAFTCPASSCLYPHTRNNSVLSLSGSFRALCSLTGDNLVLSPQVISGACCLRVLLYGL